MNFENRVPKGRLYREFQRGDVGYLVQKNNQTKLLLAPLEDKHPKAT